MKPWISTPLWQKRWAKPILRKDISVSARAASPICWLLPLWAKTSRRSTTKATTNSAHTPPHCVSLPYSGFETHTKIASGWFHPEAICVVGFSGRDPSLFTWGYWTGLTAKLFSLIGIFCRKTHFSSMKSSQGSSKNTPFEISSSVEGAKRTHSRGCCFPFSVLKYTASRR